MTKKKKTYCDLPSSGRRVEITAIAHWITDAARQAVMEEIKEAGAEIPLVPTYEVELFGGDKVKREHTAHTVKTNEEKAAWEAYVNGQFIVTVAIGARIADAALMEGVVGEEPTPEWERRMKKLKLKVPEDPDDKRLAFIKAEIAKDPDDSAALVNAIMKLSGIDAEEVARVRENFRREMEK